MYIYDLLFEALGHVLFELRKPGSYLEKPTAVELRQVIHSKELKSILVQIQLWYVT